MRLYLVRHAIAVPRGAPGVLDDRSRELTPAGVKKMRRNVAGLARLAVEIDEIWTSPLVRARQTADLLAEGLHLATHPRVVKGLEPGGDINILTQKLAQHADRAGVALVGHEPDLGELATYLLTGARQPGIRFGKGAVACVEVDDLKPPLRGRLRWLLTSKQMKLMT
jgi:phosphohistidine phosphatase